MSRLSSVRLPAVAGTFYPKKRAKLRRLVLRQLAAAVNDSYGTEDPPPPKALVVPHAGYVYSGLIAASAYRLLTALRSRISRVVLLGPAHFHPLAGIAVHTADAFRTPLGDVLLDDELRQMALGLVQVLALDSPHEGEHSLEVQLPFLQQVLDRFTLLPLVVGRASPDEVAEVLEAVWGGDETLILISTDLSHYHDYDTACELDAATCAAVESCDHESIADDHACGARALRGMLEVARRRKLTVTTLELRNSGDTAGDRASVVGYGAWHIG